MKKIFSLCFLQMAYITQAYAVDMPQADYAPPAPTHAPEHIIENEVAPQTITSHSKGPHTSPRKVDHCAQIVAVVNDRIITMQDLNDRLRMLVRTNIADIPPEDLKRVKRDILLQMIDEKLQLEIIESAKIIINDEDVKSAIRYMEEQNHVESGSILRELKEKGVSDKTIKDHFGAKIGWSRLISYYRDTIEVGKKDLAEQEAKKDVKEKQFLLAELVFPFETLMDEDGAHEQAIQALSRIHQGDNFSQVAYEVSHSPSAATGGDIGWIQESQCEPAVRDVLRFLKPGELSRPIKTEKSYKVILLRNVMLPNNQADTLTARQLEIKFAPNLSEKDREEERIRLDGLFETIEGCEQFDRLEDQLEGELHIYKDVSLPDLSKDLQDVLKDLPVGKPSAGYETENSVVYLMVCKRSLEKAQHVTHEEKSDAIVSQRLGAFAEQKLRDIRRVAAIDIRL